MSEGGIAASIGIDIGASKANIGVLDADGAILAKTKVDIRGLKNDSDATLEAVCVETTKVVDGAGIILGGKIFKGGLDTSGEVGHMIVQQDGEPFSSASDNQATGWGLSGIDILCELRGLDDVLADTSASPRSSTTRWRRTARCGDLWGYAMAQEFAGEWTRVRLPIARAPC